MNIFILHDDPVKAAQDQCDKHVVKRVTEYGQMLSTAHRVLDGELYTDKTKNGRNIKRWRLKQKARQNDLYKASHVNHPSNIWTRENEENYRWLFKHFQATAKEYEKRYGRVHATYDKLGGYLWFAPHNINRFGRLTKFAQAMPEYCKREDPVEAYRFYYIKEKVDFAKWKNTETPIWFKEGVA